MTLREIRRAGARAFFSRRWFGRALTVSMVLYTLQLVVAGFFAWARKAIGFSSWTDFLQAKAEALRSGLDYVVPSRTVALNYTYASSFEVFFSLVVAGICLFGATTFVLRMLRREEGSGYFAGALGGFARPLGTAWLLFRINVQMLLWSCVFIVPGVVAYYRYRAAWYLKAENPDWSAGKCLAESARVMNGHKMRCFTLDLTYLLVLAILTAALLAVATLGGLLPTALNAIFSLFFMPIVLFAVICFFWHVFAGRTVFYLSIERAAGMPPQQAGTAGMPPQQAGTAGMPPQRRCGILPHPEDNNKESTQQ